MKRGEHGVETSFSTHKKLGGFGGIMCYFSSPSLPLKRSSPCSVCPFKRGTNLKIHAIDTTNSLRRIAHVRFFIVHSTRFKVFERNVHIGTKVNMEKKHKWNLKFRPFYWTKSEYIRKNYHSILHHHKDCMRGPCAACVVLFFYFASLMNRVNCTLWAYIVNY